MAPDALADSADMGSAFYVSCRVQPCVGIVAPRTPIAPTRTPPLTNAGLEVESAHDRSRVNARHTRSKPEVRKAGNEDDEIATAAASSANRALRFIDLQNRPTNDPFAGAAAANIDVAAVGIAAKTTVIVGSVPREIVEQEVT